MIRSKVTPGKLAGEVAAAIRSVVVNLCDKFEASYPLDSVVGDRHVTVQVNRLKGTELDRLLVSFAYSMPHARAEETLNESEERFRQIAANLQEILWILDATTYQVIYVSPYAEPGA